MAGFHGAPRLLALGAFDATGEGEDPLSLKPCALQFHGEAPPPEAERRLFYVAFTRARKRIVMLSTENVPISRFVLELGLPGA